jgi:hypothetical protein
MQGRPMQKPFARVQSAIVLTNNNIIIMDGPIKKINKLGM